MCLKQRGLAYLLRGVPSFGLSSPRPPLCQPLSIPGGVSSPVPTMLSLKLNAEQKMLSLWHTQGRLLGKVTACNCGKLVLSCRGCVRRFLQSWSWLSKLRRSRRARSAASSSRPGRRLPLNPAQLPLLSTEQRASHWILKGLRSASRVACKRAEECEKFG